MLTPASVGNSLSRRDVLLLASTVLVHAGFNSVLSPFGTSASEYPERLAYAVMGVITIQPILLAMWAAMGVSSLARRLPWAAVACLLLAYTASAGRLRAIDRAASGDDFLEAALLGLGLFLVSFVVLLLVRRVTRMHMQTPAANAASGAVTSRPRDDIQFGTRYLLGWTTASALLLGMGRVLAPGGGWVELGSGAEEMFARISGAVGMFLVLLAPPVAVCWLTLTKLRISLGVVAGGIISWAMLTWISAYVLHVTVAGSDSLGELLEALAFIQLGATAAACLTTVPLRLCGYRLRRSWQS